MRLGEGRIAELAAQGFQLLVPRGAARTVRRKIVEIEVELDSKEIQDLCGDELTRSREPARIPQRA